MTDNEVPEIGQSDPASSVTVEKAQLAQRAASYNPEPTPFKAVEGDPTGMDVQVGGNTTINAAVEGRGDNPNGVAVYTTPGQVPVDNEHPGDGENPEGTPHPDGAMGVDKDLVQGNDDEDKAEDTAQIL